MSNTMIILLIIAVVFAVAAVVWLLVQRNRSRELRAKFGNEYDRLVAEHSDRRLAEAELQRRQHRVEKLRFRALTREESDRFSIAWRIEQERFVDDPHGALTRADALICEVMGARGYQASAFEDRAAEISVHHPHLVEQYRSAHDIAIGAQHGKQETEALRIAMQHFRQLFEELVNQHQLEEARM
ncbi:MAG: hypothetical protein HY820_25295 [Acidobacteria bacterium]|nr:hypothetical protein [Acidobacteriota bacterium]